MAAKRKTNTQYYHDLKFEFLGFDEMELYQPTADWLPNVYKTKDGHPKKKLLSARDLTLDTHFTKMTAPGMVIKGLKSFLESIRYFPDPSTTHEASIQSQILTISGDIMECSNLLYKSCGKYKQEYRFLLSIIAIVRIICVIVIPCP